MFAFSFRGGRWTLPLTLATVLGACQEPVAVMRPTAASPNAEAGSPKAPATVAWNQLTRDLVVKYSTNVPAATRMLALLSVAQYNAIVTAEKQKQKFLHPSDAGAVAGASVAVLSYIYPQEAAALEDFVAQMKSAPGLPGRKREDFAAGEAIGRAVAAGFIARAQTDRFTAPFTGMVPVCDGCWVSAPPGPSFATLGQVKPYFLTSNSQFRPAPPPAFGSAAFVAALAEVRQIADTRTPEQDSIAKFWALPGGTIGAQGYFNKVAAELVVKHSLNERKAAQAFALLNMAALDVLIASHEAKYHYWLLRPRHADPAIAMAIGLPNFPSFPSNHSALAASAAVVLSTVFPGERAPLEAMAQEGAISRLYGGIHYRFDTEAGLALGRKVAEWTLAHDVKGHEPFVIQ